MMGAVIDQLQQVQWREPLWLLLALVPVLLALLHGWYGRRALRDYAEPRLLPWVARRPRTTTLRWLVSARTAGMLAWPLLAIAAAGPRIVLHSPGEDLRNGVDIMAVVDLSRSMSARDVEPSRLRRAAIELHELLERLHGDRMGLVVVAGHAHLLAPLTFDREALAHYVDALQTGLIPTAGSNLAQGLSLARTRLLAGARPARAVVLLTDGDVGPNSAVRRRLLDAGAAIRRAGMHLYVLGLGTTEGGGIPTANGGWLQHRGTAVISRLQEPLLRTLAERGGGIYTRATDDDSDWELLYDRGIATLASHTLSARQARLIVWRELYPWVLFPGLVLLFLSLYPWPTRQSSAAVLLLAFAAVPGAPRADAGTYALQRHAFAAYQAKDFAQAHALYRNVPGYAGRMGEGASCYRQGDYDCAIRQFSQAVLGAGTDRGRTKALFDLGNSHFQLGDYKAAVDTYRDALRYAAGDHRVRHNLILAARLQKAVEAVVASKPIRRHRGGNSRHTMHPSSPDFSLGVGRFTLGPRPQAREPLPQPGNASGTRLADLIARGVRRARAVALAGGGGAGPADTEIDQTVAQAQAAMERLHEHQAQLWRSLFESEEGFAAPVEQPRVLPGVRPW